MMREAGQQFYCAGHPKGVSSAPVLTALKAAPLRCSKTPSGRRLTAPLARRSEFWPSLCCALLIALGLLGLASGSARADDTLTPLYFQSQGVLGSYDKAALQRGFLVYETVCASCHSANALHYRDLEALGFSPDEVAGIASGVKLADGSPATLDDVFKAPSIPAGAFGGAVAPDLSNIEAQRPRGARYVYDLLTGYGAPPPDLALMPSHYYNAAYPGNQIAMPAPLKGNDVTYADGTAATVPQEAQDVAAFLAWSADPNLDARHEIGLRAVIFFVFLAVVAIATKRKIWREMV